MTNKNYGLTTRFLSVKKQTERNDIHDSFPLFDWLRFLLASVVVLSHESLIPWAQAGNFAVQIFFALSGWLIGGILLHTNASDLPIFYYNRATRIWIPYGIAAAVIYGLAAIREPITEATLKFLFHDLTFTHNWFIAKIPSVLRLMPLDGTGTHFWSISVEEQFYLAAPLLILFLPNGRSILAWVVIACALTASGSWYGSISLGVLAAVVRFKIGDWHLLTRATLLIAVAAGSLMAIILSYPKTYPVLAPLVSISIVLLSSRPGRRNSTGVFLGGVSYPLYLYHWIGAFAVHWMQKRMPLLFPGAISYLIAVCSGGIAYLVVDRNVLRYRARLYSPSLGLTLTFFAYFMLIIGIGFGISGF